MKHLTFISSLALAVSFALPVSAASAEAGWSSVSTNITYTGTEIKRKFQGATLPLEAIYTGTDATPGNITFTCFAGSLSANVAFDPVDMKAMILNPPKTRHADLRRPDIKINGEFQRFTDWYYMPKLKIYRTRKRSTAAKLYNSVIRGSVVEMRPQGDDYMPINLPPADRVFSTFGSECGIGIAAKKS